jgi:hypothetical protein
MTRRLHRRSIVNGQITLPAVPGMIDQYMSLCESLFATVGRPFTAEQLAHVKSVLEGQLAEAYANSPRSNIVISFDAPVGTVLNYHVKAEWWSVEGAYAKWIGTREPPLFGTEPDARIWALATQAPDAETHRVLDIGGGTGRNALALAGGISCQVGCGRSSPCDSSRSSVAVVSDIDRSDLGWPRKGCPGAPTLTYATSTRGGSSGVVRAAVRPRAGCQARNGVTLGSAIARSASDPALLQFQPGTDGCSCEGTVRAFLLGGGFPRAAYGAPALVAVHVVRPRCAAGAAGGQLLRLRRRWPRPRKSQRFGCF